MTGFDHMVLDHHTGGHRKRPDPKCHMCAFDALRAENERLRTLLEASRAVAVDNRNEVERLRAALEHHHDELADLSIYSGHLKAENDRLRVFLKYVKGRAQDEDNVKLMDEIDDALAGPKRA